MEEMIDWGLCVFINVHKCEGNGVSNHLIMAWGPAKCISTIALCQTWDWLCSRRRGMQVLPQPTAKGKTGFRMQSINQSDLIHKALFIQEKCSTKCFTYTHTHVHAHTDNVILKTERSQVRKQHHRKPSALGARSAICPPGYRSQPPAQTPTRETVEILNKNIKLMEIWNKKHKSA